jgi:hypothetical protein
MNRSAVTIGVVLFGAVLLAVGLLGTVGLSDANADRQVSIEVVEQSDGVLAIETRSVSTTGNGTTIGTVTNRGNRTFAVREAITGQPSRTYTLHPGDASTLSVQVDCQQSTWSTYTVEIDAETDESMGRLRIESSATVTVQCLDTGE